MFTLVIQSPTLPQSGSPELHPSNSNFNIIRLEAKIGNEEINIQAEKNYNALVKHDETRTVKNDRTTTIYKDDTLTVETGNLTITVSACKITATAATEIKLTCGANTIDMTPVVITITAPMVKINS